MTGPRAVSSANKVLAIRPAAPGCAEAAESVGREVAVYCRCRSKSGGGLRRCDFCFDDWAGRIGASGRLSLEIHESYLTLLGWNRRLSTRFVQCDSLFADQATSTQSQGRGRYSKSCWPEYLLVFNHPGLTTYLLSGSGRLPSGGEHSQITVHGMSIPSTILFGGVAMLGE